MASIFSNDESRTNFKCTSKVAVILAISACSIVNVSDLQAREKDPEPIENPGECPIDAPLRVASLDSLRQFDGLIGHCPETSIIESPAHRANRPQPVPIRETNDTEWFPQADELDARLILAKAPRGEAGKSRQTAGGRVDVRADGSAVTIIPDPNAFSDPASIALGGAALLDTDGDGDAEAILALRPQSYTTPFDEKISRAARAHGVDPLLLHAVITQESRYRHRAVSHAGARGLMQVMPGTGRMLGVAQADHLFDPDTNIQAGAKLLSDLWQRLDGNIDLVLAAYNAGEGAVRKYNMTVPPYRETRDYVVKVKAIYSKLAGESGLAVNF